MNPPTPISATSRRLCALAILTSVVLLSGCAPRATPTPTPTAAFASEEEAFAAAEKTYRAYTDALNQVDFGDPSTFEAVYAHLSSTSAASTRKVFSEFHAAKVQAVGRTRYDSFTGVSVGFNTGIVSAHVCVDVSDVDVIDESGESVVSPDRPARQPMLVTFKEAHGTGILTISAQDPAEDFACAP